MGFQAAALALTAVSTAVEVSAASSAAAARTQALDRQAKQTQIETQQKMLSHYSVVEKVLDSQVAHMTTTGTAFSSPSYNAIQRDTLNIGAKHIRNANLEGELQQDNINIEKQNVNNSLYTKLFGIAASKGIDAFEVESAIPRLED